MAREIMDFTDLGEYTEFKYQKNVFGVPSFTKGQLMKLIDLHSKMASKRPEEEEEDKEAFNAEGIKETLDFEDDFIVCGIRKKNDDGTFAEVSHEEFAEYDWPVKVKHKVMSLISQQMSFQSEGEINEKN